MKMSDIPFGTTDVGAICRRHGMKARSGFALWRTQQFGDLRVRMVEYSAGYKADHWCTKGHILLVVAGELETELADGRVLQDEAGHQLPGRRRRRAAPLLHPPRRPSLYRRLTGPGA